MLGKEGPGVKYNPKVDAVKEKHRTTTIGHGCKIDQEVISQYLKHRSPGPMYNVSRSFVCKSWGKSFGNSKRQEPNKEKENASEFWGLQSKLRCGKEEKSQNCVYNKQE